MKNFLNTIAFSAAFAGSLALALPASAQTTASPVSSVAAVRPFVAGRATSTRAFAGDRGFSASTTVARVAAVAARADTEIQNRVSTLNNLMSRIQNMVKLSSSDRLGLTGDIQSEINSLSSLQGTIGTDNSTTSVRTDAASITKAYRIYALVVPQSSIVAAADRVNTLVTSLTTIDTKITDRLTAVQSAGTDTSSLTATMADFTAKVSDAATQSAAATSEVANLAPDNGDQTILASNTAALKDARAKLQTASQDLQAARQDAETVIKAIQALPKSPTTNTASTTTQ